MLFMYSLRAIITLISGNINFYVLIMVPVKANGFKKKSITYTIVVILKP